MVKDEEKPYGYIYRATNRQNGINFQLVIVLHLIILIIFQMLVFILFYLTYTEIIIDILISFEYFYYYLLLISIMVIRIGIVSYLSYFFFREWNSNNQNSFMSFQYFFGLYFYFTIFVKSLDIVVYIMYIGPEYFQPELLLNIFKIRHIIGALSTLPMLSIGTYLFVYYRNLKKEIIEIRKIAIKYMKIILSIWMGLFLLVIFLLPSPVFSLLIYMIFSVYNIFIIWVFIKAYKGKILPEINCLIISIGFIILFAMGYIPTILIYTSILILLIPTFCI